MREGGAAALSQSHGARPARQFLKPRLRGGPGRRAQALQGRQGVSAQRLGSRPKTHTRGGEEGGAEPTPRPGARLASSRPGARSGAARRGAARAEGGVFPGRDCRENTGDPYSWSGESTAGGREPGKRPGCGVERRWGAGEGSGSRGRSGEERGTEDPVRPEPGRPGAKGRGGKKGARSTRLERAAGPALTWRTRRLALEPELRALPPQPGV